MTSYDYGFQHQLERTHFLKSEVTFRYIEIRNFKVRLYIGRCGMDFMELTSRKSDRMAASRLSRLASSTKMRSFNGSQR